MTSPPVVVGRYRLDELYRPEVDTSTWKATDLTARRPVLACLCAGETGAAARSRRTTVHPGLATVLDVVRVRDGVEPSLGSPDPRGEIFVILDPPEGEPLDRARRARTFDSPESLRVTLAVANALTAVHAKGSVHGGVCPAAIELRPMEDGGPRLGLRGIGDASLAYASPSRLCDGGPSLHDDAWGLLGVLYFLLTGSPPFSAETPQALARRVLGGRPIPIKMAGPADAELQKIFDRGFSRTAAQRFPDVAAVRDDLRGWLSRFGSAALETETEDKPDTEPAARDALRSAPTREMPSVTNERASAPGEPLAASIAAAVAVSGSARRTMPFAGAPPAEGEPLDVKPTTLAPSPSTVRTSAPPPFGPIVPLATPTLTSPSSAPEAPGSLPATLSEPPGGLSPTDSSTDTPSSSPAEEPPKQRSSRPEVLYTAPQLHPTPPARRPPLPPTDETVRFSRDQLQLLESERDESAPLDVHVSEGQVAVARSAEEREETTEPSIDVHALMRGHAAEGPPPAPPKPAAPMPVERPPAAAPTMLLGFLGGVVVAVILGAVFVLLRPAAPKTTHDSIPPTPPAAPSVAAPLHDVPSAIAPVVARPAPSASASPSASANVGAAGDVGACVRGAYADGAFAPDTDLAFVCEERSARKAAQRLQRAIVAGGRGRAVTDAMKEWSQLRWFELPVVVSLRGRCCPSVEVDLPTASPACPSVQEAVQSLAKAARGGGDLDEPVRDYRRLVTCLVSTGDAASFGQDGPITGGEDTTFRAFAARLRK